MPCYLRAFLQCTAFAFVSWLCVFTPEDIQGSRLSELTVPDGGSRDVGDDVKKSRGLAGREPSSVLDRCKSQSGSYWDPYWRPPDDVCGLNFLESSLRDRTDSKSKKCDDESSHLAVVACGPRLEETLTMLKSAVLFSKKPVEFYIFAEDQLHDSFRDVLHSWPQDVQTRFNFTIYPIMFPTENEKEWKKLFKPCASQRLFLPLILKEVDSLLYVDTDVLFLQPVEDIWALLAEFNASQLAAMAPEHEEPRIGWYNRFARHPYYGQTGVNSGVMLMNMTRLRETFFKFSFGDNMESSLLQPLEASLQTSSHSYCGRVSRLFTKRLKQSISSLKFRAQP
uniref:glucoside xylosyltransferase 1-like isoform X3 n=1 Tax=Doryrhamphus excisus TaxID=161450 RepID=UPI0025ADF129|nr:glucoside xylosyltransferase 1-like isoform X3 [Doryrhamphus excisus]